MFVFSDLKSLRTCIIIIILLPCALLHHVAYVILDIRNVRFSLSCRCVRQVFSFILLVLWTLQLVLNFGQICTRCSCEKAEEKVKLKTTAIIASRRSRLATPSMTPGGRHTPVPIGQSMPPFRPLGAGPPPPHSGSMSLQSHQYPAYSQSSEAWDPCPSSMQAGPLLTEALLPVAGARKMYIHNF